MKLRVVPLFLLSFCMPCAGIAQQSADAKVTIRAVAIFSTQAATREDEDYRYKFWLNREPLDGCIQANNQSTHRWINVNYTLVYNRAIELNTPITIDAKAWEEDGCGGDCKYNGSCGNDDEGVCNQAAGTIKHYSGGVSSAMPRINSTIFTLNDMPPGNSDNMIEMWFCGGRYRVRLLITYIAPTPDAPTILVDGKAYPIPFDVAFNLCNERTVRLTSGTTLSPIYNSQIQYVWEYHINGESRTVSDLNPAYCGDHAACNETGPPPFLKDEGFLNFLDVDPSGERPACCSEPQYISRREDIWRSIGTTTRSLHGDTISFDPRQLQGLNNITFNKFFYVRVKVITNGLSSALKSGASLINISPLAPAITSLTSEPTCPNSINGRIQLTNTGLPSLRYVLKAGFNKKAPCNPDVGDCFAGLYSGNIFDEQIFTINNIDSGDYTLWLANNGNTQGSCYTTENIRVDRIPDLSLQLAELTHVTCNGASTGNITLSKGGGAGPFHYTISGIGTNSTGVFSSLPAGRYETSVTDGCSQNSAPTLKAIFVKQPRKVSESAFSIDQATCSDPGNGKLNSIVIKSTGEYDTTVSTLYDFTLLKDGSPYASSESSSTSWLTENLAVSGNYQLNVSEKGSLSCNAYSKTFAISAPPALSITGLNTTDVSCYNGTDGSISFAGTGGSGLFNFKLSKAAGDTLAGSDGSFSNLTAGDYRLVIENDLAGCRDKLTYGNLITVTQPTQIAITLTKSDITCFGFNNGGVTSLISGGTPGYTYTWEKQSGSIWEPAGSGVSLSNQASGNYRLEISDNHTCTNISNSVSITEPTAIATQNISVSDIKCFGESGLITAQSTGGTLPYSFTYALNTSSTFNSFTSGTTPLSVGNYRIKTTDNNGCSFTDPGTFTITTPPTALDFTYVKSDYNGYNISCVEGNNGFINVEGTGGNGASYSGYQFALDGSAYVSVATLSNINAGNHSVAVRDNRGCIVSKNISFTETAIQLSVATQSKQDVLCFGDLTGSFQLTGSGGVSPYKFSLDSSPEQSSPAFNSLGVGIFTIGIKDANNCTSAASGEIVNLNPKIEFTAAVSYVNCFGGADGSILLDATGGSQPFQFGWNGNAGTSNTLSNLTAGQYTVLITDNVGCKLESSFVVSQPASALAVILKTTPTCYGETTGEIETLVTGGTSPYQYSNDGGQTFQNENIIASLGVGTHTILVLDSKGCPETKAATVIQRNDRPEPNFLVSTRQNAFDTLIVKEVSDPKPDSIDWIFDSNAIVISDDPWSPELKFTNAGTYYISMTGYFGACDYTIEKTLTLNPFDPTSPTPSLRGYRAIESISVSPNPGNGEFDLKVILSKKNNLSVVVYDMVGVPHVETHLQEVKELNHKIDLNQSAEGIYLIRVITDTDARDIRIIIQR